MDFGFSGDKKVDSQFQPTNINVTEVTKVQNLNPSSKSNTKISDINDIFDFINK
jgi:hypothetical protein